jgi:hypothetical protein
VPISANDLAYGFYSGAAAQGYTYVGFYCTLTNSGTSTYATSCDSHTHDDYRRLYEQPIHLPEG